MSYNIKGAFHFDNKQLEWENRRDYIFKVIKRQTPDIIGLQEVMKNQLADFKEALPNYEFFGKVRSTEEWSEHSTIGYNKETLELLDSDTFWLSDTPEIMSKTESWQAGCYRVVTWGLFKEKSTGRVFTHLNTHFDNVSELPRFKASEVLKNFLVSLKGLYTITGDFNGERYERFYTTLTTIVKDVVLESPHHVGPMKTCNMTEVGEPFLWEKMGRIDYIFASPELDVKETQICDDRFGEFIPSDHYPVVAIF